MRRIRRRLGPAPGDPKRGFHSDAWASEPAYRAEVARELSESLREPLERLTTSHKVISMGHVVKWPGTAGSVTAHRDPSFVDETRHRSLTLWCPLERVDRHNGVLWVVPGSHLNAPWPRVHEGLDNLVPEVEQRLEEHAVPISVPRGSAVLFDHGTIHYSAPNVSGHERVAVAVLMAPARARTHYAVATESGRAELIETDADFFVENRLSSLDVQAVLCRYPRLGSVDLPPGPAAAALAQRDDTAGSFASLAGA